MTTYKCFHCDKKIDEEYTRNRIRCPYCGSKLLFKERKTVTHVKAR